MKKCFSTFLVFIIAFSLLVGCGKNATQVKMSTQPKTTGETQERISIVCTMFPQYDFVRQIVGDKSDNYLLLTPGADTHSYEPTTDDMIRITKSDIFIYIGDQMETWASSIIKTIDKDKTIVLNLSQELGLNVEAHAHEHAHVEDNAHEKDEKTYDPHIWTSPVIAAQMMDVICDTISRADSLNSNYYKSNSDVYRNEILQISSDISEVVSKAEYKKIYFSNEFALTNFVNQYALEYMAAFDTCGDNAEASALKITQIMKEIKANDVPVIFYSELKDPREAKSISDETGAQMKLFHSCHNVSQADFLAGETYISLMGANVENLKIALGTTQEKDGETSDE